MCIVWAVSLHKPTTVLRYGTRPPAETTDGDIHSAKPTLFSTSGFTPHRVPTAWAQRNFVLAGAIKLLAFNNTTVMDYVTESCVVYKTA